MADPNSRYRGRCCALPPVHAYWPQMSGLWFIGIGIVLLLVAYELYVRQDPSP